MNTRTSMALGIAAGYVLGRKHRMRWAAMLGAAAASGRLNGLTSQVLEKGTNVLRSTPELSKLADSGQRLVEAGRGAAVSAMNSRMDSMGESLKGRSGQMGRFLSGDGEGEDEGDDKKGRRGGGRQRDDDEQRPGDESDDYDERDEDRDEDEDEDEDERDDYDEEDEEDEDEDEEDEEEPEPVRAGQRGGGGRQSRSGSGARGGRRSARTGDGA
jgi:hypothetical protein